MAAAGEPAALAAQLLAAAPGVREQLVGWLREITALDAPSGDPEALTPVAALLESWLGELGGRVRRHPGSAGPLLEAELGPAEAGGGTAMVLCHYDTVWPRGTAAERPIAVEGEVVRGPGVLDMRGGIVATLAALRLLGELEALSRPVRLLITPDEETGSRASRELIVRRARGAEIVLVPEPALAGGGLKTERKGWIVYELAVRGRSAHAGLEPEAGVSAVDELVDRLVEARGEAAPAAGTTINCGIVAGGAGANVVAESARAELDVRVASDAEERRIRDFFAGLQAQRPGAELRAVELHSRPPLQRTAAVAAAAKRARSLAALLGFELGEGAAGGVSDANLVAAEGVPVLDGLGPEGGGAHAVDEHLLLPSLLQRTALIALLLAAP